MARIEIARDRDGNPRSRAVYFNPPGRYVTPSEPLVTEDEKVLARARRMSLVKVLEDSEPDPEDATVTAFRTLPPSEGVPGEPGT